MIGNVLLFIIITAVVIVLVIIYIPSYCTPSHLRSRGYFVQLWLNAPGARVCQNRPAGVANLPCPFPSTNTKGLCIRTEGRSICDALCCCCT
jgi:hypothetical protein